MINTGKNACIAEKNLKIQYNSQVPKANLYIPRKTKQIWNSYESTEDHKYQNELQQK